MKVNRVLIESVVSALRTEVQRLEDLLSPPQGVKRVELAVEVDFPDRGVPESEVNGLLAALIETVDEALHGCSLLLRYHAQHDVTVADVIREPEGSSPAAGEVEDD